MKLSELQFVPDDLVEKAVRWAMTDAAGELVDYEGTVEIRRLSYGAFEMIGREAEHSKSFGAQLIAECVVWEGGEEMSYDMAFRLPKPIGKALFDAVVEVNSALAPEKK